MPWPQDTTPADHTQARADTAALALRASGRGHDRPGPRSPYTVKRAPGAQDERAAEVATARAGWFRATQLESLGAVPSTPPPPG